MGLRIHVRAKRFSGDGPEALMDPSRGILGELRVWISSCGGAEDRRRTDRNGGGTRVLDLGAGPGS